VRRVVGDSDTVSDHKIEVGGNYLASVFSFEP
jgi:hypothetical protein